MPDFQILAQTFNLETWKAYLHDLFPQANIYTDLQYIALPANNIAENGGKVGELTTSDGKKLGIYHINLKENTNIARNKAGTRGLLRSQYSLNDDGIIATYKQGNQWRLSYISEINTYNPDGTKTLQTTDPRRYTYLLGEGEKVKTAAYRLQTLFDNRLHLSLNDLKDAFSVEKLNKDFYQELSHWYFWAISQAHFPFLHIKTNETDAIKKEKNNAQQLIRLITRVIFIWFMKQKKLLPQALFDADELAKIVKDFNAPNASGYYNAILQNLFFGTLNQPVTERKFAKDGDFPANKSEYGVKSLYRYANKLTITEEQACQLFRTIPFLNGGLFDCLDDNFDASTPGEGCIDGFSRNPKHTAVLPDDLFFGQEKEVDLNTAFNTKKKVYKVKGLFHLLNAYQFTTNENTTLDIEVALDPELLGKVFENLLACYNPETQNTARNDTGSFYTPREIVSYMVDESLLTILTQQIGSQYSDKIKTLLTTENFENNTIELTTQERNQLIEAIDKLRILDPACGSGAYPMGILHAMVQLLQRIDPDNKLWREYQREKMIGNKIKELENDRTIVEKLSDDLLRQRATAAIEDRLNELETLFNNENHESDYTRKLYLIENCIYGIDLQPIAVQISKLRFFISLVIDQNTTDTGTPEDNYGIRSLPNLETKFVAADALIKLHSSATQELAIVGMDDKEQKLRNNRHEYFLATTRKRKIELQKEAQKIRGEIAALLTGSGWNMQNAQKIADFDPYNQNKQANWFDPKYMFGINSGFDIVIGNPPYIQLQNNSGKLAELYANQQYATYARTGDIYMLFYERGHQLLKNNGILCYITSNKWMRTAYGEKLRIFFSTVTQPTLLFDFSGHKIFESATVDVNILQFTKAKYEKDTLACTAGKDYSIDKTSLYFSRYALPTRFTEGSWVLLPPIAQDIKQKVEKIGIPLKDWDINIYRGVITGLNEAFIIDQAKRDELVAEDPKSADIIRPILRGRDIQKYKANWANYWVITVIFGAHKTLEKEYPAVYKHLLTYEVELKKRGQCRYTSGGKVNTTRDYPGQHHWLELDNNPTTKYMEDFYRQVIAWQRITQQNQFCLTEAGMVVLDSMAFISNMGEQKSFLLAILNSKYVYFWMTMHVHQYGDTGFRLSNQYVEEIPIPKIAPSLEAKFNTLVDKIIAGEEVAANQQAIDRLIYGLFEFTEEEIAYLEGV